MFATSKLLLKEFKIEADVHFDCFPTNTTVFLIFTLLALTRKNQQFIPLMLITDIQTDPTVQQTGIMVSTERCRGDASPTQITSPLPPPPHFFSFLRQFDGCHLYCWPGRIEAIWFILEPRPRSAVFIGLLPLHEHKTAETTK